MPTPPRTTSSPQQAVTGDGASPREAGAPPPQATRAARQRRRGWLLVAAFAWNTWLFTTRIWNLLTGPELETRSTGFVVVHMVLYVASLAVGAMVGTIGWRLRREASEGADQAA